MAIGSDMLKTSARSDKSGTGEDRSGEKGSSIEGEPDEKDGAETEEKAARGFLTEGAVADGW